MYALSIPYADDLLTIEPRPCKVVYVTQHGQISRSDAMELCRLSERQAKALLKKLTLSKQLQMKGAGSASFYIKSDETG